MTESKPPVGELLPCPFCGSKDIDPTGCSAFLPEYQVEGKTWDGDDIQDKLRHFPACNNCNATTDGDWNTRSGTYIPADDFGRILEALEIALPRMRSAHDHVRDALALARKYGSAE